MEEDVKSKGRIKKPDIFKAKSHFLKNKTIFFKSSKFNKETFLLWRQRNMKKGWDITIKFAKKIWK